MATKKTRRPGIRATLPLPKNVATPPPPKTRPAPRANAPRSPIVDKAPSPATIPDTAARELAKIRARAEQSIDTIETLRSDIGGNFYKIGCELRDLKHPPTYRALGHTSFHQLLGSRRLMSRMQADKLVTVVDAFPERVARRFGVEKALKIVRYAEKFHPRLTPLQVIERNPRLTTDDGKRIHLADIEIKDLVPLLNGLTPEERQQEKKRTERATRQLAQLLPHAGIDPDRVRTIRRRSGTYAVRLELSAEEAADLVKLLESRR